MQPIPAVEVPVNTPKPPPRPELYLALYRYPKAYSAWYGIPFASRLECESHIAGVRVHGAIDLAIFTLPAQHPAPVADWRERCKVVQCDDGRWDFRVPESRVWLGRSSRLWLEYDGREDKHGQFPTESDARRALAAAPQPPEVSQ